MDALFMAALLFTGACFLFRRRLGTALHAARKAGPKSALPLSEGRQAPEPPIYRILAFNARDYGSAKELEDAMELRLEKCLAGIARQGKGCEVEFHSTGFVLAFLIRQEA